MERSDGVKAPELERQARRMALPASRFLVLALLLAVPGVLLIVFGSGWVFAVGLALAGLALVPAIVSAALYISSGVAHHAARERPFA